jgi:uncharacterized membrane protein
MRENKFRFYKILIVVALAIIISSAVTTGSFVIPIVALVAAIVAILLLKTKVKDVMSDERAEKIGGFAARLSMTLTSIAMAITSFVFVALRQQYPELLTAGYVLSYFVCGMLILYSIVFKYKYSRGE